MKKLCTGIKTFDDGINLFCLLRMSMHLSRTLVNVCVCLNKSGIKVAYQ